jgi:hypothetical protein
MTFPITPSPTSPERLPDESARAYRAYCYYRDLGPSRSLDKAWERYRSRSDRGKNRKSARRPGHWGVWSHKFSWVSRAEAYDDQIDEQRRDADFERRRALREQRSRFEVEEQSQIENNVRMLDAHLERMGSAHHHEVTQVKTDEAAGKKITTKVKGFNPTGIAALTKARNQTAKQAILGVRDLEEEEKEEGIVDRIVWERPEETPPNKIQAIDDIAQLKKEKRTADDEMEDLEDQAA